MASIDDYKTQLENTKKELKELEEKLGIAGRREANTKRRFAERDEQRGNRWEGPPSKRFQDDSYKARGSVGVGRRPEDSGRGGFQREKDNREERRTRSTGNGMEERGEHRIGRHEEPERGIENDNTDREKEVIEREREETGEAKPSMSSEISRPQEKRRSSSLTINPDRERRIFGVLLGTLKTFQKDSVKMTQVMAKRKSIQMKIEEREHKELEDAATERKALQEERKNKLDRLAEIREKMAMTIIHTEYINHHRSLANFIQLKSSPSIFYIPGKHNDKTSTLLEETRKAIFEKYPEIPASTTKAIEENAEQEQATEDIDMKSEDGSSVTVGEEEREKGEGEGEAKGIEQSTETIEKDEMEVDKEKSNEGEGEGEGEADDSSDHKDNSEPADGHDNSHDEI